MSIGIEEEIVISKPYKVKIVPLPASMIYTEQDLELEILNDEISKLQERNDLKSKRELVKKVQELNKKSEEVFLSKIEKMIINPPHELIKEIKERELARYVLEELNNTLKKSNEN